MAKKKRGAKEVIYFTGSIMSFEEALQLLSKIPQHIASNFIKAELINNEVGCCNLKISVVKESQADEFLKTIKPWKKD